VSRLLERASLSQSQSSTGVPVAGHGAADAPRLERPQRHRNRPPPPALPSMRKQPVPASSIAFPATPAVPTSIVCGRSRCSASRLRRNRLAFVDHNCRTWDRRDQKRAIWSRASGCVHRKSARGSRSRGGQRRRNCRGSQQPRHAPCHTNFLCSGSTKAMSLPPMRCPLRQRHGLDAPDRLGDSAGALARLLPVFGQHETIPAKTASPRRRPTLMTAPKNGADDGHMVAAVTTNG